MAANNRNEPTPYHPRPLPPRPESLPVFVTRELRDLEATLTSVLALLPRNASAAPSDPVPGMIRRAVAPWRPVAGQTKDRWVSFDGNAWTYLT